jgi:hypothetical protein
VGVAPLVIVPGDKLDEARVQRDSSFGIEDGGVGRPVEVLRDHFVLGIAQYTFHLILRSFFNLGTDLLIGSICVQLDSQVNSGNVHSGDPEGHTSKFSLERGDNFSYSFSCSSG